MPISSRRALMGAALAAFGIALVRVLAFDVHAIHHADALTLHGFISLDRPSVHHVAHVVASIADPAPYGVLGLVLIGIALAQGRLRVAAGVAVVLLGAAVTTDDILKPALAATRFDSVLGTRQVPSSGFPSGHATASMALALCAIVVAPPRLRPYVAALGGLFAIAVSYSFLSLGWHYPSDVLGGYLVAAAWTGTVVAAMRWADVRWPEHSGRQAAGRMLSRVQAVSLAAALGVALVGVAVAVAVAEPGRALDFLRVHTIFAAGAAAIAVAGLAVAGVLAAILRE